MPNHSIQCITPLNTTSFKTRADHNSQLISKAMEEDYHKEKKKKETVDLLEDGWFFGNFLKSKSKMVRCNSDPAPSSKTKEEMFGAKKDAAEPNSLVRAPSLPPKLGKEGNDWVEDEDDSPRMGDLIRQAMPYELKKPPSFQPCRIKNEVVSNGNVVLTPKGKLTRRSSLDPSVLLPPKHNSKGVKLNSSAPSKNLQQRRTNMSNSRSLERSMSLNLKAMSDKEVQGIQDLGFRYHRKELSPSFVNKISTLSIKEEPNEEGEVDMRLKKSPSLSEAWTATQKGRTSLTSIPKWGDSKSSSEDMKAQIKFWARAVASNVRQEC